jgi:hypothetical protein
MKPSAPPKLSSWPGMTPPTHDQDSAADFVPKKQRSYVWPIVSVLLMLVAGVITALVLEAKHRADSHRSTLSETKTAEPMIKSAIPISVPVQLPPESRLTPDDASSQIETLLKRLFAATTPDERLACISDARHNRTSVETFFGKLPQPLKITKFRTLNSPALLLPDGHPSVLCEVQTTYPSPGTAIARLVSEPDGSLRLHWPTLLDSLEARLHHFSKDLPDNPMWVNIGLRRNFGFEETETIRAEHFVFDIQGLGNGEDRTIAFAAKDQPIGRSLDHLATWNQLYMVRALVHCVTIEGRKRITLLDAELVGADDLRQ